MRFIISILFTINTLFAFTLESKTKLNFKDDKDKFCSFSGKSLIEYYKASHEVKTKDGRVMQYCSLGELAFNSMDIDIIFSTIKAVDALSEEVINANDAFYLIGSKFGVELAFKSKDDALELSKKYGGSIVNLDDAFDKGFLRVEEETAGLKYKNEKKFYPMGERIYKVRCGKIEPKEYNFINELKADLFKKCKNLDEREAMILLNYLWSEQNKKDKNGYKIEITKDSRCPVCGMFVYKHPKWVAFLSYEENGKKQELFFDGVKDMMKFIHEPKKYGFKNDDFAYDLVLVKDYYTLDVIAAKEAFYVFGSDVVGPMGNELIPFKKEEDARMFKLDHVGTKLLKFDEITKSIVCKLDGKSCE